MLERHNTKANKLRYMLKHDMGSDGDFEFRRQELAIMTARRLEDISDDEVADSYSELAAEGGAMREYLQLAVLAAVVGETLYVHGQVIGNQFDCCADGPVHWSVTAVPSGPGAYRVVRDLNQWVHDLNSWAASQIQAWIRQPTWVSPPLASTRESWRGRGGSELLEYGTPAASVPSVVYCRWLDERCMPQAYPPELVDYLRGQGIHRVVVGHTPHGNCPTVIPHEGLTVVMGDTSYSDVKADAAFVGDNRGDAASVILVEGGRVRVVGRTHQQQIIDYSVGLSAGSSLVGRMQSSQVPERERHFVKAKLYGANRSLEESSYLMCRVEGFRTEYTVLDQQQVLQTLDGQPLQRNRSSYSQIGTSGDFFGHDFGEGGENRMLRYLFKHLDRDGNGVVSKSELLAALTERDVRDALAFQFPGASLETIAEAINNESGNATSPTTLSSMLSSLRMASDAALGMVGRQSIGQSPSGTIPSVSKASSATISPRAGALHMAPVASDLTASTCLDSFESAGVGGDGPAAKLGTKNRRPVRGASPQGEGYWGTGKRLARLPPSLSSFGHASWHTPCWLGVCGRLPSDGGAASPTRRTARAVCC